MNNERRSKIQEAIELLEEIKDAEQEAFDNMPESFQQGEKGEAMELAISGLDAAISELESIE